MVEYSVAFWNVENLFDVAGSPRRSEKLQRTLAGELDGWTSDILDLALLSCRRRGKFFRNRR